MQFFHVRNRRNPHESSQADRASEFPAYAADRRAERLVYADAAPVPDRRSEPEFYAHTNNEERQLLAQKASEKFFQKPLLESAPPAGEMQKVLQILAEKPELMKLLAAM